MARFDECLRVVFTPQVGITSIFRVYKKFSHPTEVIHLCPHPPSGYATPVIFPAESISWRYCRVNSEFAAHLLTTGRILWMTTWSLRTVGNCITVT